MNPELEEGPYIRDDDEGLFSRDIDGQLVRLDTPTQGDYGKTVTLQIDGQSITVPMAEPLKDAQGNIVLDVDGQTTPRYTTIYDAAVRLYVKEAGDYAKIPIPTLCHQEHMKPVAVCRLCVVQIYGMKRGKRSAERKLLPACQHQVKDGMEVFTMNDQGDDGARVRTTVKTLTEMLAVDHLKPAEPPSLEKEFAPFNELGKMSKLTCAMPDRLKHIALANPSPQAAPKVGRRGLDASSPVFMVDHSACILCERCIRACGDVQENHIIGRTGKGANAGIGFDLNDAMGSSGCVQCGECMVSCPTSAIMFKPGSRVKVSASDRSKQVLSPEELLSDPLFSGISPKFLLWQQGLVIRRSLSAGDTLCKQGDAGNTAYLLKRGPLEITVEPKSEKGGMFSLLRGAKEKPGKFVVKPEAVIVGEMACMSGTPRTATVKALENGEVWEVRRNVLDRLMRLPSLKLMFENKYRKHVLDLVLRDSELFENIEEATYQKMVDLIRPKLKFVRVSAGQPIFKQGDKADAMYLVRLGHVRVGIASFGGEAKVISRGPGSILGEIGLLALSPSDLSKTVDEADETIREKLEQQEQQRQAIVRRQEWEAWLKRALQREQEGLPQIEPIQEEPPVVVRKEYLSAGNRSASCSALGGQLELARLDRDDFLELLHHYPVLRRRLVEQALGRLRGDNQVDSLEMDFVKQGLYEGRSILVLDMDLCTRCDECTKGCIEKHGGKSHGTPIPRLLRDGMRFDRFLVATSCRSCTDAHCMVGCPVDSIHRGRHLQIVIEDHCIGCGLCADNCPYGSIFMVPNEKKMVEAPDPRDPERLVRMGQLKAAACDLCDDEGHNSTPKPQCVASCPHEAAFRMTGDELKTAVAGTY